MFFDPKCVSLNLTLHNIHFQQIFHSHNQNIPRTINCAIITFNNSPISPKQCNLNIII